MPSRILQEGRRAFTLVEMLIVVAIILLILSISAPLLSTMAQRRSLEGSVEILKVEFLQLRERASSTGQPVVSVLQHYEDPMRLVSWSPRFDETAGGNGEWFWVPISATVLPEGVWMHDDWYEGNNGITQAQDMTAPVSGIPYEEALSQLLASGAGTVAPEYYNYPAKQNALEPVTYAGTGNDTEDFSIMRYRKKCFAVVFMPDGTAFIIGRPNVPTIETVQEPPSDTDLLLTNGVQHLFIDINPPRPVSSTRRSNSWP